jgi:hypothetical protein
VTPERRRWPRRRPTSGEPLGHARLRTGAHIEVSDISDGGARARTATRLLPGTHVDVHLMTRAGRVLQRAHVLRAAVARIDGRGLAYDIALAFDSVVDAGAPRVAPTRDVSHDGGSSTKEGPAHDTA